MPDNQLPAKPKSPVLLILALIALIIILVIVFTYTKKSPVKQNLVPVKSPAPVSLKISIPCPSVTKFCQQGKELIKDGHYLGIGAILDKNSPLIAVFDGEVVIRGYTIAKKGSFTQINLTNPKKDLTAIYYVTKASVKQGLVKKGEIIATNSGEPMSDYNNYNLLFLLLDQKAQPIFKDKISFETGK